MEYEMLNKIQPTLQTPFGTLLCKAISPQRIGSAIHGSFVFAEKWGLIW